MKKLSIKSIELINFKGEQNRKVDFGSTTIICGHNGIGKSRIFDAFCWCLFGKDSRDRKDYEVQTRDSDGNVIHHLTTEVTVKLLSDDGTDVHVLDLNRKYEENWVKPRGCTEARLNNRETMCSINDIPMSVNEYGARVSEIIDSQIFKLITNPMYFSTVFEWRERRQLLFDMIEVESDEDICSGDEQLSMLMEHMNGYNMNDYRKMIVNRRNKAKSELESITPRIDQTERMKPVAEDWEKLTSELQDVNTQISDVQRRQNDASEAIKAILGQRSAILSEVSSIETKIRDIVRQENEMRREILAEPEKKITELNRQKSNIANDLASIHTMRMQMESSIQVNERQIQEYDNQIQSLRDKFMAEKTKSLEEYRCPSCGQQLPAEKVGEIRSNILKSIAEEGKKQKEARTRIADTLYSMVAELEKAKTNFHTLSITKSQLDAEITELENNKPQITIATADDIPECIALMEEKARLEASLKESVSSPAESEELKSLMKELSAKRDDLMLRLGNRKLIEKYDTEIENLKTKARELVQLIADYQRDEDALDRFTRTKVELCESRINAKFKSVSFRLFNFTLEGNIEECCEPLIGGALFSSANTAGQINAGLEILDTISEHYQVSAPVWVDNAESINNVYVTNGQQILLRVTDDNELIVL